MNEKISAPELLQQIHSFIAVTRAHTGTGGDVDLSGLDDKVQELCERVLDMPKSEADEYREALAKLADELTDLKSQMETAQNKVRDQLNELNARHKAVKAYKTNEAIKHNEPKE